MKGPGRCLHSIRNTSTVSCSSSQPAVSQSLFFVTSQTWGGSKLSSERWSGPNTELINVMCSCRKTPRTKLKIKSCCWHSCFDPTQIFIKGPEVKPSPTDGAVGLSPPQTEPAGTSNNRTMDNSGLFGLEDVFFLYSPDSKQKYCTFLCLFFLRI